MSYLGMEAILHRLRNGVTMLSPGEQRTILNHLVEEVDELKRQVKSLRGPESSGGSEEKNPGDRVRRGRKPKQDSNEAGSTTGNA
tara:strand:- start:15057 stop:15311 length:255 start_codon:yes stop_codon:yes gene_type:complete